MFHLATRKIQNIFYLKMLVRSML